MFLLTLFFIFFDSSILFIAFESIFGLPMHKYTSKGKFEYIFFLDIIKCPRNIKLRFILRHDQQTFFLF